MATHAQQQREGAIIDRITRRALGERSAGDHRDRARERRARPVEPQPGKFSDRDDRVGQNEDDQCGGGVVYGESGAMMFG